MVTFSQWLRGNSERYLLESAQAEMARRYLDRPGPPAEPGLGPLFWRRVFVPVYRRLPWRPAARRHPGAAWQPPPLLAGPGAEPSSTRV